MAYGIFLGVNIPSSYNTFDILIKTNSSIMKRLSLIIAVVILFVVSSCAPSYMCPTYANVNQAPAELVQNDL